MDKWIVILYKFDQVKFVLKIQLRERRVQLCNDVISSTSDFNADLKYVSYDAKQHRVGRKVPSDGHWTFSENVFASRKDIEDIRCLHWWEGRHVFFIAKPNHVETSSYITSKYLCHL